MKQETIEQIKKMVGTEFSYVFPDHAELPAVVAAFDPEVGFTCLATSLVDSHGRDHSLFVDDNGNLCLSGFDKDDLEDDIFLSRVIFILRSIRCLGYYRFNSNTGFGHLNVGGQATCSF